MVLIRADANEEIGTGHVMRCLSLARAFIDKGEEVCFITADHRPDAIIESHGFKSICLDTDYSHMDDELGALNRVIHDFCPSLLVVDSYYVTEEYFLSLSNHIQIAYLDDLNTSCWEVDYLINYNIFAMDYDYSFYDSRKTKLLLSTQYVPLRTEFHSLSERIIKEKVSDVLVTTGGSDPERITERIMDQVCEKYPNVTFHFVIGALNPRINELKKKEVANIVLHINETHMAELMQKCDFAIAAAGSTIYELCACGTPTITFSVADNQKEATEALEKRGIMISLGDCRYNPSFDPLLSDSFDRMIDDYEYRVVASKKMKMLIDGNGAERLVAAIISNRGRNDHE